jgi:hypothetical protein
MKEILKMINSLILEFINGQMASVMREAGKMD